MNPPKPSQAEGERREKKQNPETRRDETNPAKPSQAEGERKR